MTKSLLPPSKDLQLASRGRQVHDDPSHHRKEIVLKETQEEKRRKKKLLGSPEREGVGLDYITVLTESGISFTYIQQYIYGKQQFPNASSLSGLF